MGKNKGQSGSVRIDGQRKATSIEMNHKHYEGQQSYSQHKIKCFAGNIQPSTKPVTEVSLPMLADGDLELSLSASKANQTAKAN
jgi:hypothetical protein